MFCYAIINLYINKQNDYHNRNTSGSFLLWTHQKPKTITENRNKLNIIHVWTWLEISLPLLKTLAKRRSKIMKSCRFMITSMITSRIKAEPPCTILKNRKSCSERVMTFSINPIIVNNWQFIFERHNTKQYNENEKWVLKIDIMFFSLWWIICRI